MYNCLTFKITYLLLIYCKEQKSSYFIYQIKCIKLHKMNILFHVLYTNEFKFKK